MSLTAKQTQFLLDVLDRVVLLLPVLPEIKQAFMDANGVMKKLIQEDRDPTEEELSAISDENQALYEQLQS